MLPEKFLENLREIYNEKTEEIIKSFYVNKKKTFRINFLKISDFAKLEFLLNKEDVKYERLLYPSEFYILKSDFRAFQETEVYKNSFVYVQNPSSYIPVLVLDLKKNDRVLDLCAAPGSKTSAIAAILGGNGELFAVEKSRNRFFKLKALLKEQGGAFVNTFLYDGSKFFYKYNEYFDKVLVDVPCSSEARFNINEPESISSWNHKKSKNLQKLQKSLLYSAINSAKKGGIIVYSTCTFSILENEIVVDWALKKFHNNLKLIELDIPLDNVLDGLIKWKKKDLEPTLTYCKRIIPNNIFEGFFIAKFRKI